MLAACLKYMLLAKKLDQKAVIVSFAVCNGIIAQIKCVTGNVKG